MAQHRTKLAAFIMKAHTTFSRVTLLLVAGIVLLGSTGCMEINSQRLQVNDQDLAIPKALRADKVFKFKVTGKESMGDHLTLQRIGKSRKFVATLKTSKKSKTAKPVVEKYEVFFLQLKNAAQANIKINYLLVLQGSPDKTAETFVLGVFDGTDSNSKPVKMQYFAVNVASDGAPKELQQLVRKIGLDSWDKAKDNGKITTTQLREFFSQPIVLKHLSKGIVGGELHLSRD